MKTPRARVIAGAMLAVLVGGSWFVLHRKKVADCNSTLAFFGAMHSNEAVTYDVILQWKDHLHSGRARCIAAGMDHEAATLDAVEAEIDRQVETNRAARAKQAAAAESADKERRAAASFPAESAKIAEAITRAASMAKVAMWPNADVELKVAEQGLASFSGTSIAATDDWKKLSKRAAEQRARIQPELDKIAAAAQEKARQDQIEAATRGEQLDAEVMARMYIEKHMRNPDSFEDVEHASVARGPFWQVTWTYRGTNAFGAIVTESATICVSKAGAGPCR